jgi:ATP-dependent helicase/nuclease subunit B
MKPRVKSAAPWLSAQAVFTIAPHLPFLDCLAAGIAEHAGDDPLALANITVLLPTRRACRSLREAFLRQSKGLPLLLPRLMPLNDMDEEDALLAGFANAEASARLPPAIAPLKRQLLLAKLIAAVPSPTGETTRPDQAVRLAAELARLLDQAQTERLGFDRLANLAPAEYAEHWQITLTFLEILTAAWPAVLADEGAIDPATHRNLVFAAQIEAWKNGSTGPVIAAGSTGSIPATADLLATIANLPQGCVVLPGLDQDLDDESWTAIDDAHPQAGLKYLLAHMNAPRDAVKTWPAAGPPAGPRTRLVSEAMRPAAATDRWRNLGGLPPAAVNGLSRIDCPGPREEAEVIALVMRESLDVQERTCALVTPDRRLAERVATELARWNIEVDDSAGRPLEQTPPGAFLRLLAAATAESFAPVATLALCKHPLAAAGLDVAAFRSLTRQAELHLFRGPRPAPGLEGLRRLAAVSGEPRSALEIWLAALDRSCGAFAALMEQPRVSLAALLEAHLMASEALAGSSDLPGPLRLWANDAGEMAAAFAAEVSESAGVLDNIEPGAYPALLEALMAGRVVRPRYGLHPRLSILGPLEARLQRFDVTILGGLNEGTWPNEPGADPWMSRPMRAAFGLPSPERRIGLAAHDIAQALCGPRVVATRALKVEGTPTVPSRWLRRLDQAVAAAGLTETFTREQQPWLSWALALNQTPAAPAIGPPAPKPPVAARPRRLSVTEIERWMRDPYSIYARHILGLKPLDPLEQDVSVADYGMVVHKALQTFVARHPSGTLPANAYGELCTLAQGLFAGAALRPSVMAFWWPRFQRIAAWFLREEATRRHTLTRSFVEVSGEIRLATAGDPFTLIARADRIDLLADGTLRILDYKTGAPPRQLEVLKGYAPQLPLEAVIASAGGFTDVPSKPVSELAFWRLHGRDDGGDISVVKGNLAEITTTARDGLLGLIAAFDDPATGYEARPNPEMAPVYSDYLHLARVKEWAGDEDEA